MVGGLTLVRDGELGSQKQHNTMVGIEQDKSGKVQRWTRMQTNRTKMNGQLDHLSVTELRRVPMKIGSHKSRDREHTSKSNC